MRLTTLARVKRLLNIETSTTQADSLLNQLIDSVSRQIERFLGRHIDRRARTETYDIVPGQEVVYLKGFPVATSPAPQFRDDIGRDFTGDVIDSDVYHVDYDLGVVKFDRYSLIEGPGVFQSIYTGGLVYSLTELRMTVGTIVGVPAGSDTITGGSSGATGTSPSLASTVLTVTCDVNGDFWVGETVSNAAATFTAVVSSIDRSPMVVAFADLCQACETQVAFDFRRKDTLGVNSMSAEGSSVSLDPATKLLKGVVEMLRPYKSMAVRD